MGRQMKFTQRRIETLECPAGRRDMMVFDDEQLGLGVRVTAGGGKSFLVQYRRAGEKRRVPLGSCSAISLAGAREAARAILGDVAKGKDPAAERKQAIQQAKARAEQEALTLGVLIDQWEAGHLADKRAGYRVEATRALRFAFRSKLGKPAADLDPGTVKREVHSIAAAGKLATARLTAAYGRACYGWAIGAGLLETNPFQGVRLNGVPSRERVLTDAELAAIWKAVDGLGSYNSIVRLLLLTGQRREEVAGMTWNEITDDLSAWTISAQRAKNGVAHIVPLSPQAQVILRAAPRYEGTDPVFPGRRGPFNGFGKAKAALDEASGVKDWRLHDLRRTMATGLQRLGVRLEVTEAVLNHVAGSRAGIIGVYQRHTWSDEKRAALNAWGAHVEAIVEGRESGGNVTPLRRSG
jgi:integrase